LTVPHGPGGAGKSQWAASCAVALALGKPYGRLRPRGRSRVLLPNFEDDKEEQERRIAAALRYFDATTKDLEGWLFRVTLGPNGDPTMFKLDENGQVCVTECWEALQLVCEDIQPDAIFPDPLVAINGVPENNNTLVRRVMVLLRGMAKRFNCAVVPIHHDNKAGGDDDSTDQTNARGGGDIVNAVRFELAIKTMSVGLAQSWGIDLARRGFYFRVGSVSSKRNYTAPEESEWFERLPVVIAGEDVVRCIPWEPPSARLDEDQTRKVVEAVENGTKGRPYSPQLTNTDRSLAPVLEAMGITVLATQKRIAADLVKAGKVTKAKWHPSGFKSKDLTGLRAASGLPYAVDWAEEEQ
jgi:hypothetical protein